MITTKKLATFSKRLYTTKRPSYEIFDRALKNHQKLPKASNFQDVQYLKEESIKKIISTLSFINRDFSNLLDIGSSYGHFVDAITKNKELNRNDGKITGMEKMDDLYLKELQLVKSKLKNVYMVESNKELLDFKKYKEEGENSNSAINIIKINADEETLIDPQLTSEKFNCLISNLSMHWINNLPSFLDKCFSLLKPKDSIFIGSMFAQDTLFELRSSLQLAELERKGGISPHVSPFVTVQDLGNLLNKSGFKMITIDIDEIVIEYPDLLTLMNELQLMGENNCLFERENLSKDVLLAADSIYKKFYGIPDNSEGKTRTIYPATFRVLFFIGWRDSTIQHAEKGSQTVDFKDIL